MAIRTISLCAGVGGIDLGLRLAEPDSRTVCYVEWSHFPAAVIAARIEDKTMDDAPVWDDVGTFDGRPWRGVVDLVTAGFPCQPVSLAGKRQGMADERFIWDDVARIIGEVGPERVLLENVPGILSADNGQFLGRVLGDLADLGYDTEWDLFSAEETGAPHRRQRWFCLAVASGARLPAGESSAGWSVRDETRWPELSRRVVDVADTGHGLIPQPGWRSPGRNGTGSAGQVLGDPNGSGREEQCGAVPVRAEQSPTEPPRRSVGDAQSGTRLRDAPGPTGHIALADEAVADADDSVCHELRGQKRWAESRSHRVYPPARNDHAGWAAIDPGLEPAICRDADGLASGLDPALFAYRADRLRAVGNGVVPLTAALAWIELNSRFGG